MSHLLCVTQIVSHKLCHISCVTQAVSHKLCHICCVTSVACHTSCVTSVGCHTTQNTLVFCSLTPATEQMCSRGILRSIWSQRCGRAAAIAAASYMDVKWGGKFRFQTSRLIEPMTSKNSVTRHILIAFVAVLLQYYCSTIAVLLQCKQCNCDFHKLGFLSCKFHWTVWIGGDAGTSWVAKLEEEKPRRRCTNLAAQMCCNNSNALQECCNHSDAAFAIATVRPTTYIHKSFMIHCKNLLHLTVAEHQLVKVSKLGSLFLPFSKFIAHFGVVFRWFTCRLC